MNEFMFAMLRKNNITCRVNESFAIMFFNMRRTAGIYSDRDESGVLTSLLTSSPFSDANTDDLSAKQQYNSYATNSSASEHSSNLEEDERLSFLVRNEFEKTLDLMRQRASQLHKNPNQFNWASKTASDEKGKILELMKKVSIHELD